MSGPSPVVADAVFLRPWQKVGLWVIIGLVFAGILVLFSGRMSWFHREQAKSQPATVQMDTNISPLNKPPIALAQAVPPPRPAYVQQQNRPPAGVTDDDRASALNSNIGIYQ